MSYEKINLENMSFGEILELACGNKPKQSFTEYIRDKNENTPKPEPVKIIETPQKYTNVELVCILSKLKGLNINWAYSINIGYGEIHLQGHDGLGTHEYLIKSGFMIKDGGQFKYYYKHPFKVILT